MLELLKRRDTLFDCEDDNEHVIQYLEYQIWKKRHAGVYN